jgi:nucleoside-diphosphate-sugar epimerase
MSRCEALTSSSAVTRLPARDLKAAAQPSRAPALLRASLSAPEICSVPDMGERPQVLVTGAAGAIGSLVVARLRDRWQLRPTDLRPSVGVDPLDVVDLDSCMAAFAGMDAVVHLAANPDQEAGWSELRRPNVDGAYTVAAAARACGVRRLVLASSLHAVSALPETVQRRSSDPPRPANLYGATKAWAEALGAWVAATSSTSVVALRIGYFSANPPAGQEATPRNLAAWLSPADCVDLIRAAVESDVTGLTVVSGVSANRYRVAELGEAERRLGYRPIDDAWEHLP